MLGDLLEVAQGTCGDASEDYFFCGPSAHSGAHLVEHLLLRGQLALLGEVPGGTQGASARNNGHLDQRRGVLQEPAHGGVARLVVGDDLLLFRSYDLGFLLEPTYNAVYGVEKVLLFDYFFVFARCDKGRFVADVGNVSSTEPWRLASEKFNVHIAAQLEGAQVHLKNFNTLANLRKVYIDNAVKTACTHQCSVQNIGAVGGTHHNDVLVGSETIHLGEKLVERVFSLVVAAAEGILAAGPPDGINLVDKNDARRLLFGLLEQVTHTTGANANKHFYEIGSAQREERHLGFAGNRLGKQGFSRPRRATQQHTLGNFASQVSILLGVFEKVHHFKNLVFGPVKACDVFKGDFNRTVGVKHLRTALTDVEDLATRSTGTASAHAAH